MKICALCGRKFMNRLDYCPVCGAYFNKNNSVSEVTRVGIFGRRSLNPPEETHTECEKKPVDKERIWLLCTLVFCDLAMPFIYFLNVMLGLYTTVTCFLYLVTLVRSCTKNHRVSDLLIAIFTALMLVITIVFWVAALLYDYF